MFYDEPSRSLDARDLAALCYRRNIESTLAAMLGSSLAIAIVLPIRLPASVSPVARFSPIVAAAALAGIPVVALLRMRRAPPAGAVQQLVDQIERKRRAGAPVAALARGFVQFMALSTFVFALVLSVVLTAHWPAGR